MDILHIALGLTATFLTVAVLLCAVLFFRRIARNRAERDRKAEAGAFENFIRIVAKSSEHPITLYELSQPDCHIEDKTVILLRQFRTLKGELFQKMVTLITGTDLEAQIIAASQTGVRGSQMRAVQILSYLSTQQSLLAIHAHLDSPDNYKRLTAARALARRKAFVYLTATVEALAEAFPQRHDVTSQILSLFGEKAVPDMENIALENENPNAIALALEVLALLMPPQTRLDLSTYMRHSDEGVRAAAVSLSVKTRDKSDGEVLRLALMDQRKKVKLRAVKLAENRHDQSLFPLLHRLVSDPDFWIRYWAVRALWSYGRKGRQFVAAIANNDQPSGIMAANVAAEQSSGYV